MRGRHFDSLWLRRIEGCTLEGLGDFVGGGGLLDGDDLVVEEVVVASGLGKVLHTVLSKGCNKGFTQCLQCLRTSTVTMLNVFGEVDDSAGWPP